MASFYDEPSSLHVPEEPLFLQRAERYLEVNACQRVTLGEVAEVAGVGVRVLEEAFRFWRGMAPLELFRDPRFGQARRRTMSSLVAKAA